ncbi:DUF397 domain-containing protein [Embleya sp. AB8]
MGVGGPIVPVRDSKDPSVGRLVVGPASWSAMVAMLRTV